MKLFTIGFTRKSAQKFFGLLSSSGVERVVDVRLNNVSQLAGFAKRDDLEYFLRRVCGIDYVHLPALAPRPYAGNAGGSATGRITRTGTSTRNSSSI